MSVLERFERQAKLLPDAIAVCTERQSLSYRELDERANQIAFALSNKGVRQEMTVGLFLSRNVDLISGLLGIWKAGGAYVPLDPELPQQRISFMLEDCNAELLLTERSLLSSLPSSDRPVLCIEDAFRNTSDAARLFQRQPLAFDQLAYILYTSGSTGKPKGAAICHGAIENNIVQSGVQLELSAIDVVLSTSTIAFDFSCLEIFATLVYGARLFIVSRESARDGILLMETIKRSGATTVMGTPTQWSILLESGWKGDPRLKIVTAGEALPLSLGRKLASITKLVWNHYGPTETTISVTTERVDANAETITIGRPLENVDIHILDESKNPVAKGEVGEIYIGGICVGRGYVNRPDLTAATFLPDPFNQRAGARIYKTGDLGRELPDGRIEYYGRKDDQVKIRGHRIELSEIEETIRSYKDVRAVSVLPMEISPGDQRLVAFVQSQSPADFHKLTMYLQESLPAYMIPAEFVAIEKLPVNANGKVDRSALKSLRPTSRNDSQKIIAVPRNGLERRLQKSWERVLQTSQIGIRDDFFELGGNSFLAARLFTEIEKETGVRIPLSMLIENPTVELLAQCIREQSTKQQWPGVVTVRGTGNYPPFFLAHGLGGSILLFRDMVERLSSEQPVYGLQIVPGMVKDNRELTIPHIASLYIQQMKKINPFGPYHVGGHSLGALVAYEIASQLSQMGEEVGLLALFDWDLYFPFSTTPLFPSVAETSSPVLLKNAVSYGVRNLAAMLPRAFQAGGIERIYRKYQYEKLRLQYLLLKHFASLGHWFPRAFREDVYVAVSTQNWSPQSFPGNAVVFMAADQLRAHHNFGAGWTQVVQGECEVLHVPGTHQSMFHAPNVNFLAEELMKRLRSSNREFQWKRRSVSAGS